MNISLKLKPEVEARLIIQANAQGVSIETYLESLIEEKLTSKVEKRVAPENWTSMLDRLGRSPSLAKAPMLSDEDISRESIYD
ncbi:hypothetical protein WA1_46865 [Scytonema hofmannii PCC 7110]|uniref:Toxin-antitoxin system, antitoxin component n=1 Tax=Scytonema hofmannii PCC 7110 TaxID=128403 RepID=A0A139WXK1_9CYAN|nr:hypothetical protein [Scytonema hofmannii]KYC37156.1 hypothetical protein WA1_46865 [Scytonema hofmannii PCC 7110]